MPMRMSLPLLLAIVIVAGAAAAVADAPDTKEAPIPVLVFSRTAGFRHASIAAGTAALRARPELKVTTTEDPAMFTVAGLEPYEVVVFLNTTGDVLNAAQQSAFETFIRKGGGFVGVHAAADTEYEWPWYGRMVGAYFKGHPAVQPARIRVIDGDHCSTEHLPVTWERRDEWYDYRAVPDGVRVLLELDETSYSGGGMGEPHPIAWCHAFDGGRAWYTGGGHTDEAYAETAFMQHLVGGIRWAAGQPASPPGSE